MSETANLREALDAIDDLWHPRPLVRINDYAVKAVKVRGEFIWHSHAETDELFVVLRGQVHIDLREAGGERRVTLGPDDLYVVPRGIEHRPVSEEGAEILLLEPADTVNTGDAALDDDQPQQA
jgi:mannose-6-phosphate isomerase-like protein (cupin superfamily)